MTGGDDDFYALTFSQREGKAPLPEVMQLEHVTQRFRLLIWQVIGKEIDKRTSLYGDFYDPDPYRGIPDIVRSFRFDVMLEPHDGIPNSLPSSDYNFLRDIVLSGEYHEVITLVEYIIRHEECNDEVYSSLVEVFEKTPVAYFVQEIARKPTVSQRASRESGEATQRAIETICEGGMDAVATHFYQAAEHINSGEYADAIVDSIHAVESVARNIDPKSSTLGKALKSLEKAEFLSHELKQALEHLYIYTNRMPGLRHAKSSEQVASVGMDEALLMFGACASFAAYLTQKHRRTAEA